MVNKRGLKVGEEIDQIRHSLQALDRSLGRLAPFLSTAVSMNGATRENGRARPRLSPKGRASLILQGRYMGYMRQLKPRQKLQIRKIRETKGVKVAIQIARRMGREWARA